MLASIPLLLVMLPLYWVGANLYSCGDVRFYTTIAYLADNVAVEWCVAVCGCLTTMAIPFLLTALREQAELQFSHIQSDMISLSWGTHMCLMVGWLVVLLVFSIPTALYALSTALPADNTLGLSKDVLRVFHGIGGLSLYLTMAKVAPYAASQLIKSVTKMPEPDPLLMVRFLQSARLIVSVIVPTLVVIAFDNSCFSSWLHFWSPCADHTGRFDTTVSMQPDLSGSIYWEKAAATSTTTSTTASTTTSTTTITSVSPAAMDFFLRLKLPYHVTSHSDICSPPYASDGQCSRAVLTAVFNLIFAKCFLAAFAIPAISMMRSLSFYQISSLLGWLRQAFSKKDHHSTRFSLDKQLATVSMLLEYLLMLGFMVPVLLPLVSITLAMNCAVYHCAVQTLGLPINNCGLPSLLYLYLAWGIGIFFMIWFYLSNDLHGKWLVCFGVSNLCSHPDLDYNLSTALHETRYDMTQYGII